MNEAFVQDALRIIRATRELSLPGYGNIAVDKNKTGDAVDVVTKADFAVEEHLSKNLGALDSGITFVGEEYGGNREAERFWLCDPIDGTGNYVRGIAVCSTMVACIENGKPTFGAIYDFVNDDMYHAVAGGGAFRNGEPIHVSSRGFKGAYIYYESLLDLPGNIEIFNTLRRQTAILKTMSAGYEFAMVASGKAEARICKDPHGKDYDFVPGCLLVAEAGGTVANLGSDTYDYRDLNFVASTPEFFTEFAATNIL